VTGTFDNWSKTERLELVGDLFQKTVVLPESSEKIFYKFVVDGRWTTDHTAPQELDHEGNENNILLPEQMDKLEEASLAAAINNLVPESTTAQLAGEVPLEPKKEEAKEEEGVQASSDAAVLSSAAPGSTTAQLAAAVPLEEKKDEVSILPVKTPANELDQEVRVNPLPAAEGAVNPIKLEPGEKVPDATAGAIDSNVTLDKESYEQSDRLPGLVTVPVSPPEAPANELDQEVRVDPLPAAEGAINPIKLAPGEPVPRDAIAGAVDSHVTLDQESYEKSDRIPGLETLPPVTDNLIPESSLPIAGAGEFHILPVTGADDVHILPVSDADNAHISSVHPESTTAALAAAVPLEPKVPEIVKQSQEEAQFDPEASANAEEVKEKAAVEEELLAKVAEVPATSEGPAAAEAAVESVAPEVPAVVEESLKEAGASPEAAAETAAVENKEAVEAELLETVKPTEAAAEVASEVPAEVKESIQEAGESPEAAANAAAVEAKQEVEAELLEEVKPTEAAADFAAEVPAEVKESIQEAGESPEAAASTAAVEAKQAVEAELLEEVKPVEAAEEKPTAVEPPQPVETIAAVDEAKPAETAEAVEPPQPAEPVKAVDEAPPAETAAEPATTNGATNGGSTSAQPATANKPAAAPPATSEKKRKHRISGFFTKLKHKFA